MQDFFNKIFAGLKARLREKSTWLAIIGAITAVVGIEISPEQTDMITTALVIWLGGVAVATPEKK